MVFRLLFLQYTLLCFVMTTVAGANSGHIEGDSNTSGPESDSRAIADESLSSKELSLMTRAFAMPEDFVKGRWNYKLPAALAKATSGDKSEDDIALILARALATIGTRPGSHYDDIPKLIKEEAAKLETSQGQYAELLKRLYWMTEAIQPGEQLKFEKGAQFDKFQTAFDKALAKVREETKQFYADLSDAENPNSATREQSKEKLRKRDPKLMFAFMKNMADKGNTALANRLGNAVAFNENGRSFLQASIKGGRTADIQVHDGDVVGALKKFEAENPTIKLTDLTFSQRPLTKPADIKVVGPKKGETVQPPRNEPPKVDPPKVDPPKVDPPKVDPPANDNTVRDGAAVIAARCNGCHGATLTRVSGGLKMPADLSTVDKNTLTAWIERIETTDDPMPPTSTSPAKGGPGPLSAPEIAKLKAWRDKL